MNPRAAVRFRLVVAALHSGAVTCAAEQQDAVKRIGDSVAAAIAACFQAPKGFQPPYPSIALLLNFRPDGHLDGPPQLVGPPGGGAKLSTTTTAMLTAATECARLDNAARFLDHYPAWKSLRLIVRPGAP